MSKVNKTALQIEEGVRPYKVYTALLSQDGTDAPVATVLENTLGWTFVWERIAVRSYKGVLEGSLENPIDLSKTFILQDLPSYQGETIFVNIQNFNNDNEEYTGQGVNIVIGTGDGWSGLFFEIRVYP